MGLISRLSVGLTYPQAEVEQKEHVERHVDLQREVLVEVLTGLDGTKDTETKH